MPKEDLPQRARCGPRGAAPVAVKNPTGGPCSERMRSCDRDAKGFTRSKDTSFSLSLLYAIPDGRPPGFTIVLIRQTNPTSLRLRALNRRLITRPDTKGIGLDLDSTDERAPWKTLKRVSRWQRENQENGKGERMGGGNALKCQGAAAMHLCQCGIHQAQLSPRKRGGGNSKDGFFNQIRTGGHVKQFQQILYTETLG